MITCLTKVQHVGEGVQSALRFVASLSVLFLSLDELSCHSESLRASREGRVPFELRIG